MSEVSSAQDVSVDKIPQIVLKVQSKKEATLLAGDQEYLEEYFAICRLYQLKRTVLFKPEEKTSGFKVSRQKVPRIDVDGLNAQIQRQEGIFWQKVEEGQNGGVKFSLEAMTSKYNLDLFEKKIMLFLLYLEYSAIEANACTVEELLCIFDTENSILSRMRNARHFKSDSILIKKMLICRKFQNGYGSTRNEISLSANTVDIVTTVLNGGDCSTSHAREPSYSETIGYVKDPEYTFDDVKLSAETIEKVMFFLQTAKKDGFERLGVSQRIKKGLGTAFLFFGPSGTGKSMLAEAVASYVGKKVLVVEYPKIMDRFVGATDKNISRIFSSAEDEDLVVLLDEADTLFYNRSFAFEEHDIRFVNEMLQELEKFKGIIVLTTNMDVLLDPALERRLSLKVRFELPPTELRLKIWQSHIPDKVRLGEGIDFEMLATKYDFSGGNIKNAALNAIRKMVSRKDDVLIMEDLIFGANLEKQGMFNLSTRKNVSGFSS